MLANLRVLGIDIGNQGVLCLLDPHVGEPVFRDLPTVRVARGYQTDPATLRAILIELGPGRVMMEQALIPHNPRDHSSVGSSRTGFKIGLNAGLVEGVVVGLGLPVERVSATAWRKEFGLAGRVTANERKAQARAAAIERYPALSELLTRRRPDYAEALLIARYAQLRWGGATP